MWLWGAKIAALASTMSYRPATVARSGQFASSPYQRQGFLLFVRSKRHAGHSENSLGCRAGDLLRRVRLWLGRSPATVQFPTYLSVHRRFGMRRGHSRPINCCFPWRLARAAIASHAMPSSHMRTNIAVIRAFLGERVALTELGDDEWLGRFDRGVKAPIRFTATNELTFRLTLGAVSNSGASGSSPPARRVDAFVPLRAREPTRLPFRRRPYTGSDAKTE